MLIRSLTFAQDSSPLEVVNGAMRRMDILNHPDELLSALANLHVLWASVIMVLGVMCILNGYRWHKWVIIACALLAGLGMGRLLSEYMGQSWVVIGALGALFAIVAAPLLRFGVAVFGGLTGAFIGANAWTALSESPDSHLAGAAMGFIALGLLSFILSRVVVVMFTSIGGAAMAVLGGITLLLHVPAFEEIVRTSLTANQLLIPMLVGVAAATGIVLQQSRSAKASAGSGGGNAKAQPA